MSNSSVPGSCGWPLVGDRSVEFYKDPDGFLKYYRDQYKSNLFESRIFNVPTIFVCSHEETREMLNEKSADFDHGYDAFLYNSYGDNILFQSGKEAIKLHETLCKIFSKTEFTYSSITEVIKPFIESLDKNESLDIYSISKAIMTKLCLNLFLGIKDEDNEMIETISKLSTLHWHGIVSLPVNLRTPFVKSGWNKALQAKEKLIKLIKERIKTQNNNNKNQHNFFQEIASMLTSTVLVNHLLLFISALIPKAFASLFTSLIYELSGVEKSEMRKEALNNEMYLKYILLEIQRLHPPFLGGRRIANKDTVLGKHKIPKGYSLFYIAHTAHTDENVFENAKQFVPLRWKESKADLFCFGSGKRQCVGINLINKILSITAQELLNKYNWTTKCDTDTQFSYKRLPVARLLQSLHVTFTEI